VGLQELLLSGKITQQEFDDKLYKLQIKNIQSVLDNDVMSHEERLRLTKKLQDLKLKGMQEELTTLDKLKMAQEVIVGIMNAAQQNDDRRTSRAIKNLEERKESVKKNMKQK
jgi:hypothetical protein